MKRIQNLPLNEEHFMTCPYREIDKIGDPMAIYDKKSGKYYMYCTGGKYRCWSSATMKHWDLLGDSYLVTEKSFGTQNYWAPEVYEYNGKFYQVYSSARKLTPDAPKVRHSIGIAVSDKPEGPFTDLYDHPLYCPDFSIIDGSLLFDGGKIYLYYSRDCSENYIDGVRTSQVWGAEVKPDFSGLATEPILLTTPTSDWEKISGNVLWNEGPCCFKEGDTFYLLFTANYYASVHYCVGYATSKNPLGPFVKSDENPIVVGDGIHTSGTGHCNHVLSPDGTERYMVYHSHSSVTNTDNPIADRTPCCDKMVVRPDGTLTVNGPSVARQPLPSGALGLTKKTGGITVTADRKPVNGTLSMLSDGIVAYTAHNDRDIVVFDGETTVTVTFDAPVALDALWVYTAYNAAPITVTAEYNGAYITNAEMSDAALPIEPIVFTGDSLPAGETVKEIRLHFYGAATLSELIAVVK